MTDLVIGMAAGYSDEVLAPFERSLARSGFDGDLILLRNEPIKWHCVVDRFELIPPRIEQNNYRYVIACDTSDIVFQSNPMEWLEKNLGEHDLAVVSEEKTFAECEPNRRTLIEAYGERIYEQMKSREVINGGIIAGRAHYVAEICREIYSWCLMDRRLPVFTPKFEDRLPDQPALSILIAHYNAFITHGRDAFAFQYNHKHSFRDGEMFNENGVRYAILHQYLYQWRDEVRARYS